MFEELSLLVGQKVSIVCRRYQYAGVLLRVNRGSVVLGSPSAIEQAGKSSSPNGPLVSDLIPNDLVINISSIEVCYQPTWLKNV